MHGARQITAHGGPSLATFETWAECRIPVSGTSRLHALAGIEQLHQHADERLVEQVAPAHVRLAHALGGLGFVGGDLFTALL